MIHNSHTWNCSDLSSRLSMATRMHPKLGSDILSMTTPRISMFCRPPSRPATSLSCSDTLRWTLQRRGREGEGGGRREGGEESSLSKKSRNYSRTLITPHPTLTTPYPTPTLTTTHPHHTPRAHGKTIMYTCLTTHGILASPNIYGSP